jgi:uncharacterized protein
VLLADPAGPARDARAAAADLQVHGHRVPWPVAKRVRVVHLTDLHIGRNTPRAVLDRALEETRAAKPDLVVMTGDYLNHSLELVEVLERFARAIPKPCLATLGNHDHWSGASGVIGALRRGGVQVLTNRSTVVRGDGWTLRVVGIDDSYTSHHSIATAFEGVARPYDALVLSHYPAIAPTIARWGGRLILSGHTHGGQVGVPIVTRALARAMGHHYLAGFYDLPKGSRLYVNVGLGSARVKIRVGNARPELAIFDLVPE